MAIIHKQLYRTSEPGFINFRDYLLDPITRMKPIAGTHHPELQTLLHNCSVHINHALNAAIIINEYLIQMMQQADGSVNKREATIRFNVQSKQISIFIETDFAGGVNTVLSPSDNLITELLLSLKANVEVVSSKHFGFIFSV
jgi:two-component sensor histidine kinase